MWNVPQQMWKMKTSPHSAAAHEKFFMACVRNFSSFFFSLAFSKLKWKLINVQGIVMRDVRAFLIISWSLQGHFPMNYFLSLAFLLMIQEFSDCKKPRTSLPTETVNGNKDKCFWKKLCLSFLLAQKAVKTIQDHRKTGRQTPEGHHPFVFPCPSVLESTKKDCNFPSFSSTGILSLSLFRMIIECGACLGLKLKYFISELFFPLQSQSFGCLFPSTNMNKHEQTCEKFWKKFFSMEKCHIKEFSPKSKKFFMCSFKVWKFTTFELVRELKFQCCN